MGRRLLPAFGPSWGHGSRPPSVFRLLLVVLSTGDPALSNKRLGGPSGVAGLSPQSARSAAMRGCSRSDGNMAAPGTSSRLPPPRAQEGTRGKRIGTRCGLPVHTTTRNSSRPAGQLQVKLWT